MSETIDLRVKKVEKGQQVDHVLQYPLPKDSPYQTLSALVLGEGVRYKSSVALRALCVNGCIENAIIVRLPGGGPGFWLATPEDVNAYDQSQVSTQTGNRRGRPPGT